MKRATIGETESQTKKQHKIPNEAGQQLLESLWQLDFRCSDLDLIRKLEIFSSQTVETAQLILDDFLDLEDFVARISAPPIFFTSSACRRLGSTLVCQLLSALLASPKRKQMIHSVLGPLSAHINSIKIEINSTKIFHHLLTTLYEMITEEAEDFECLVEFYRFLSPLPPVNDTSKFLKFVEKSEASRKLLTSIGHSSLIAQLIIYFKEILRGDFTHLETILFFDYHEIYLSVGEFFYKEKDLNFFFQFFGKNPNIPPQYKDQPESFKEKILTLLNFQLSCLTPHVSLLFPLFHLKAARKLISRCFALPQKLVLPPSCWSYLIELDKKGGFDDNPGELIDMCWACFSSESSEENKPTLLTLGLLDALEKKTETRIPARLYGLIDLLDHSRAIQILKDHSKKICDITSAILHTLFTDSLDATFPSGPGNPLLNSLNVLLKAEKADYEHFVHDVDLFQCLKLLFTCKKFPELTTAIVRLLYWLSCEEFDKDLWIMFTDKECMDQLIEILQPLLLSPGPNYSNYKDSDCSAGLLLFKIFWKFRNTIFSQDERIADKKKYHHTFLALSPRGVHLLFAFVLQLDLTCQEDFAEVLRKCLLKDHYFEHEMFVDRSTEAFAMFLEHTDNAEARPSLAGCLFATLEEHAHVIPTLSDKALSSMMLAITLSAEFYMFRRLWKLIKTMSVADIARSEIVPILIHRAWAQSSTVFPIIEKFCGKKDQFTDLFWSQGGFETHFPVLILFSVKKRLYPFKIDGFREHLLLQTYANPNNKYLQISLALFEKTKTPRSVINALIDGLQSDPTTTHPAWDLTEAQFNEIEQNTKEYYPSLNQLLCYGIHSALPIDSLFPFYLHGPKPVFPVTFQLSPNLPTQQRTLFCDLTFIIEGQEIHCHRSHVANISPYFVNLLTNDMKEKDKNCIEIKDISFQSFQKIISLQYNELIVIVDFDELLDLLTVSNQFQCAQMQSACVRRLCSLIVSNSKHYFRKVWILSQKLALRELEEHLLKIFILFWTSHHLFERHFADIYHQIICKIKPFLKQWCSLLSPHNTGTHEPPYL